MAGSSGGELSRGRVVSYALGDVANNISFGLTSMFLMVYMTDIAGVPAAVGGTIYGVTKIWAGFCDLFAGNTVDKFNSRWGHLRPWLLIGGVPLAICFVLLFSTPAGISERTAIAWILLFDAAFQLCYSFVNIPYGSLSAAMTQDSTDRSRLSGARSIAASVTGVALSAVVSPQFQDTAADGVRQKFTITTLALALLALVLYTICFRNTREVVPRSPGKINLGRTLKMVRQNRPLIVLCSGALFMLGSMYTMSAVAMYYSRYVLGHASWYTFLALAQAVGTILVASILPRLTVAFGKRKAYVALGVVAVLGYVVIYLVPGGSLPVAVIAWFLFGAGTGGTNAMMFSMQADTVDYGEWKTDIRSEGGSYSILSFIRKCGQGIGGAMGAAIIGAFGYVAKAPTQSSDALHGIRLAAGGAPAVLAVAAVAVMFFYPLTATEHRSLVAELNERRTRMAAGETLGLDAEELGVVQLGDGRSLRLTRSDAPVITLFEREGSGGTEIGPKVAQALGVGFTGQRFSSREISQLDDDVVTPNGFDRFVRSLSWSGTSESALAQALEESVDNRLADQATREVLEAVSDGGVVMGRNAAFILHSALGSFHVRLTAPLDKRAERVASRHGASVDKAKTRIGVEESLRGQLSERLFHWDPYSDDYYDLVINTGSMTYDQAADMIVQAYLAKYPRSSGTV